MTPLRRVQMQFAQALLDRERDPPRGLTPGPRRFAVYRNNVHVTLTDALGARFPVVRRLVGEAFFRAMARVFIELSPPRSPVLLTWGDDLPVFLELFPPARSVPCLADVARLEIARSQAYHAAEAEPLAPAALAAVPAPAWECARLRLHPSVRVVASAHPVVSIWAAHTAGVDPRMPGPLEPEDALVARPGAEVRVAALPAGGAAFIAALLTHGSLSAAVREPAPRGQHSLLVTCLKMLVEARLLIAVETA